MLDVKDVKPTLPAVKDRLPAKGPYLNDLIAIARDAHTGSGDAVEHTRQAVPPTKKGTFADIISAWQGAPHADRTRALEAIGWSALRGAIPQSWHAVLATPVIDVTPTTPASQPPVPNDLRTPDFLNRKSADPKTDRD